MDQRKNATQLPQSENCDGSRPMIFRVSIVNSPCRRGSAADGTPIMLRWPRLQVFVDMHSGNF
jgi:hypothetical protein